MFDHEFDINIALRKLELAFKALGDFNPKLSASLNFFPSPYQSYYDRVTAINNRINKLNNEMGRAKTHEELDALLVLIEESAPVKIIDFKVAAKEAIELLDKEYLNRVAALKTEFAQKEKELKKAFKNVTPIVDIQAYLKNKLNELAELITKKRNEKLSMFAKLVKAISSSGNESQLEEIATLAINSINKYFTDRSFSLDDLYSQLRVIDSVLKGQDHPNPILIKFFKQLDVDLRCFTSIAPCFKRSADTAFSKHVAGLFGPGDFKIEIGSARDDFVSREERIRLEYFSLLQLEKGNVLQQMLVLLSDDHYEDLLERLKKFADPSAQDEKKADFTLKRNSSSN